MDKIVVIGSPGVGKSTFAQVLGDILKIEVIHLDRHFWQPGWKELPRKRRIEIEQDLIKGKDQWIIEGTYLSSSDSRLHAADTIIFLDRPRLVCLRQAIQRHILYRGKPRPDIPVGCTDKLSLPYILKILVFPQRGRKLFFKKITEIQDSEKHQIEKKNIQRLRTNKELEVFLRKQVAKQQKVHVLEKEAVPV